MCMSTCRCLQSPQRTLDPPELEVQVAVGCPTRMLNTELGSSAKAACALNHRDLSLPRPAPFLFLDRESTQSSLASNSQSS